VINGTTSIGYVIGSISTWSAGSAKRNTHHVKHKIVPLTNVDRIGRRDPWAFRIASVLVSTGMNITLFGLGDNMRSGWERPSENYKAGLPMLAVGIPLMLLTYKRTSKNWTYEGAMGGW
jgi:hypothetical protein